ncbi:hypothetical protein FRC11_011183 [Ceratobasidium sp. 423]|nr:hypothetical protein FRC11_011183 [Ceratobasidium sp. 423]
MVHSHGSSGTHASSLAFDNWSSRERSMSRDSPAPVTTARRPHAQSSKSNQNISQQTQRSLQQRDFTHDQVSFMNRMRKRWHWYLIADDLFPINANTVLELCMQYAEENLEVSRNDFNIGHSALEFVRKKELSIRNLLQASVLPIIEECYTVDNNTIDKLNELISQSNYIYAEYNIEVLYGLQSIKAGDSSQRLGTCKEKPVPFTEKRYSAHYRNFIKKIQQYNRVEEVRKAYLEEMMREYLQIQLKEIEDSDIDIEADNEMHSDGD